MISAFIVRKDSEFFFHVQEVDEGKTQVDVRRLYRNFIEMYQVSKHTAFISYELSMYQNLLKLLFV